MRGETPDILRRDLDALIDRATVCDAFIAVVLNGVGLGEGC